MIDPIHALAFSIQANPGVYAVLLGSGVSRSARIPTGWEITLELIRKLASLEKEECQPSPEEWFRQKHGEEPNYSKLLDAVAKTQAERRQLLNAYFEPTQEEREEGVKQPTPAHRAIASMVANGSIRVILTTNFDRLMEQALEEAGITPTVISTVDQILGAVPLIHTQCCVVKLHGDYLDSRIRNTPEELAAYPDALNHLLDRVFDEFGLILCGWSGEWDQALRGAILRAPSRRYSTYWIARSPLNEHAKTIVEHRSAQVVPTSSADKFFSSLDEMVAALNEFQRPHPLSTDAAVASLKRYLTDPKYRIRLDDLIGDEVERVVESTTGPEFDLGIDVTTETFTARVERYDQASSTLVAMGAVGGMYSEPQHYRAWLSAISRLASPSYPIHGVFKTPWDNLRRYTATRLFYALGISAVHIGNLHFLSNLFAAEVHLMNDKVVRAVEQLPAGCLFDQGPAVARFLAGKSERRVHFLIISLKLFVLCSRGRSQTTSNSSCALTSSKS